MCLLSVNIKFFLVCGFLMTQCDGEYNDTPADAALKKAIGVPFTINGMIVKILSDRKIGSGVFGFLLPATVDDTGHVAMKLEPTSQAERHLNQEFEMYKLLGAASDFTNDIISEMHGISHVYYYGSFLAPHFNIIIMTLLDRNLNNIFEKCRREFTRETIIMIFLQAVEILEFIHANNVIHRDIKPNNFMIRDRDNKLFLIDFGLAKHTDAPQFGAAGSFLFCSPGSIRNEFQTKYDDLYSLIYMMAYLCNRKLPAEGVDPRFIHVAKNNHNGFINILRRLDYDLPDLYIFYYTELRDSIRMRRAFNYREMTMQLRLALYKYVHPKTEILFQWISKVGHTRLVNRRWTERVVDFFGDVNDGIKNAYWKKIRFTKSTPPGSR